MALTVYNLGQRVTPAARRTVEPVVTTTHAANMGISLQIESERAGATSIDAVIAVPSARLANGHAANGALPYR